MTIAITGHRPSKLWNDYELTSEGMKKIELALMMIIDALRPTKMISGMALGIDTLWAKLAIKTNTPLIAAVPFKGQESRWHASSVRLYHEILSHPSTTVVYVCDPGYAAWKMQRRNEWMVDSSQLLIGVWDGTPGGTANCLQYARSKNHPTIMINPFHKIDRDLMEKVDAVRLMIAT